MELNEILKKLKNVAPDSDYSRKSKAIILSQRQRQSFSFSIKDIAAGVFRSGWSMALAAVLLLLAIGSFSALKTIISPATTAVVDVAGLRAEAEVIDAQIQLTNINYSSLENKTSTVRMVIRGTKAPVKKADTLSNTSTTDEIIDTALLELSK